MREELHKSFRHMNELSQRCSRYSAFHLRICYIAIGVKKTFGNPMIIAEVMDKLLFVESVL